MEILLATSVCYNSTEQKSTAIRHRSVPVGRQASPEEPITHGRASKHILECTILKSEDTTIAPDVSGMHEINKKCEV